jgi:RND family efflux transporter MFP subunit
MRLLRNRWFIVSSVLVMLTIPGAWLMARDTTADDSVLIAPVKKGEFKVTVTTSGELRATKFVKVTGPANAQAANQWNMKIATLVPEGTLVKEGDVVAELDRTAIGTRMTELGTSIQKAQAQYEQAELDSTLNLSKAREDIKVMELGLEEKRLAKEQAQYEAPTVKRQAEIDYEKAQRAYEQAKKDYVTKVSQARAKMREVGAERDRFQNQIKLVQEVMQGFTIKAPAMGMVIYEKEWNGKKRTSGSQIWAGDPTVATLPDLTQMESQTYVNEIDIRKIAVGQMVELALDSDPSKRYTGKITNVANVGEQRPNTDAKVFEVKVVLTQSDTTLRPGMTTSNRIETSKLSDVLYIPIEAVSTDSGVTIVYKREGARITKQEIETGTMSDDEVVVLRGLEEGDKVMLAPPPNAAQMEIARLTGPSLKPKSLPGDTARSAILSGTPAADMKTDKKPDLKADTKTDRKADNGAKGATRAASKAP